MLGSIFKSFSDDVTAGFARFRDKEAAEGVVAIMIGTAHADMEYETAEHDKLKKAFTVNPVLRQFDSAVLIRKANELREQFEFDHESGVAACIKELKEAARGANTEKRIAIARMGKAAAMADGDLEDGEIAFLRLACNALEVSPSEIGV